MNTPLWLSELAEQFWSTADQRSAEYPCDLSRVVGEAHDVSVVWLPHLRAATVDAWLLRNGIPCTLNVPDRPLRACVVAESGHGFLFADRMDPESEKRFSIAHELGHFLKEYWEPRERARARLGPAVLDVFDGEREARFDERVASLLRGVELETFVHLMERTADGHTASGRIDAAELDADMLAFELLAPTALVLRRTSQFKGMQRRAAVVKVLMDEFGLPDAPAAHYAALLVEDSPSTSPLLRRLGL